MPHFDVYVRRHRDEFVGTYEGHRVDVLADLEDEGYDVGDDGCDGDPVGVDGMQYGEVILRPAQEA